MNGGMILVLVLLVAIIADTQFINYEHEIERKCSGETVYFNWTYSTSIAVFIVEWKVNGSRIASESGSFMPVTGYNGRLFKISNAQISLGPLTIADSGTYKAEVSYIDGTGYDSNQTNLIVYDVLNKETEIEETSGELRPSFYDSSITYTWTSPDNVTSTGQFLPVSISGNYTLCVSEGKASCLNSTFDPCATKYFKKVNGCNYLDTELFLGGFSCFLIVLITTIIMLIILACKMLPEKFVDLSTNKKTIKIIIIAVFILVALIIGLALGFGLKECNQRDLGLGLGLGLGFFLAIALVVTLYIYHRQCDSKKGNEDENRESPTEINSKKPEDNPKRVRSTASASHVKMESKNNTDVLKGDQSPLNKKAMYTELPPTPTTISQPTTAFTHDTPLSRKNKLVPIAMENEEANPSEKKKKKKKKKRKKSEEVGENADRE